MDLEQRFVLDPAKGALGQILIMLITSVYDRMFKFRDTGCYPNNTARELMTKCQGKWNVTKKVFSTSYVVK